MDFSQSYSRGTFVKFLKDFLPTNFSLKEEALPALSKTSLFEEVILLGKCKLDDYDLAVLEVKHNLESDPRIALSREIFSLLKKYSYFNALVVFHSQSQNWRLSLITSNICLEGAKVKCEPSSFRRHSFYLGPHAKVHTPWQFLIKKGKARDFEDLKERFSIEVVNKEFYKEIAKYFHKLIGGTVKTDHHVEEYKRELKLPSVNEKSDQVYKEFTTRLIGRIIFCWFLKQKKSEKGLPLVPEDMLSTNAVSANKNYYHLILEKLFFEILNTPQDKRKKDLPAGVENIPFLNGGLFEPHSNDFFPGQSLYNLVIPDVWFKEFFEVLETYNFTIDENTSIDVDLSVDPEMLGRIFENLLAEINPATGESARKATGSYYTPRAIVEYMVDESLKQYLFTEAKIEEGKATSLLSYTEVEAGLNDEEKRLIIDALDKIKVIDPACGSGAFPMGMLQKIVLVLQKVDPESKKWLSRLLESIPDKPARERMKKELEGDKDLWNYIRKLGIIRKAIYGVDLQQIAVEISNLRFFLSLIVDEKIEDNKPNRGIEPLPNLEFKFVAANSLIGLPKLAVQQTSLLGASGGDTNIKIEKEINNLQELRDKFFTSYGEEKKKIEKEFKNVQSRMFKYMQDLRKTDSKTFKLATWDPFSDKPSDWFDPEWMFGVRDGFSIAIANPPYISYGIRGTQKMTTEERNALVLRFPNSAEYKISVYALFMDKAIQLVKPDGGIQTFIVPDSFLLGRYFSKIRAYTLNNCEIIHISWFPYKIFEATVGFSVIYTFQKQKRPDDCHRIIARFVKNNDQVADKTYKSFTYPQSYFKQTKHNRFRLFFDEKTMNLVSKIENGSSELAEFMTGRTGVRSLIGQKKIVSKEKKSETWQPGLISGSQITKYKVDYGGDFINIDPKKLNKGGWDYDVIHNPKLLLRQTGDSLTAAIDYKGYYHLNNIHSFASDNERLDILYLLALINSKLLDGYYKITSLEANRVMAQTDIETIESLPIKEVPEDEQKPFIEIIDQILAAKNKNPDADTSNLEDQIDQMVYKLYGLTPEEIKIVENFNKK